MSPRPSILRRAAAAAALVPALALTSFAASKLDPRLRIQRSMAAKGVRMAGAASAPAGSFRVLIQLAPGATIDDLRRSYPTGNFRTSAGPVVTASVPDAVLAAFESDARVARVQAVRKLHPTLDVVRSASASGGLYLGTLINGTGDLANATGAGTVVGIVDSGIDYRHGDFRSGGTSRIKYLWDQTDTGGPAPNFTSLGFSCSNSGGTDNDCTSTEWTQSALTGGTARETDTNGHGTHVAGIAAGNGNAGTSAGTYVGMAPQADIVFVKTGFWNDEIIDGAKYIVAKAAALGEPAVINLSLGSQLDPHDGSSPFDVALAAIAQNTPVVVAMGNDGTGVSGTFPHAYATLANGASATFIAATGGAAGYSELDFWSGTPSAGSTGRYSIQVKLGSTSCGTVTDGSETNFTCAGHPVYVFNDSASVGFNGGDTSSSNDREIYVWVDDAFSGNISVVATCASVGGCGQLDGYVDPEGEGVNFFGGVSVTLPNTGTLGSPATANNVIAVGSYASKHTWTAANSNSYFYDNSTNGDLSVFSGQGPTRDGRQKPDVAAPGDVIASALSEDADICGGCTFEADAAFDQVLADGAHAILAGTSMAAPVVTGIVATRLKLGASTRTVPQVRALIQGLARGDAGVTALGSVPNTGFGYGKAVLSPQPNAAVLSLAGTTLGTSSITWTWSAAVGADAYHIVYGTNPASTIASAASTPFTMTGLLGNTTYEIAVAGEGLGIDGPAAVATAWTSAQAPTGLPTGVGWTSSATVTLNYSCPAAPNAASCSGYVIQVCANSAFTGTVFSSSTAQRSATQLSIPGGLSANTAYFLRLGTLNPIGAASYGSITSFATGSNLAAPVNATFDLFSTSTIRFNWQQGTNPGGLTYLAQLSTAANYSGTLTTLIGTAFNATFDGLDADTTYYFRVQAAGGPYLAAQWSTIAMAPAVTAAPFPAVGATSLTAAWANPGNPSDTLYRADLSTLADFSASSQTAYVRTTAASFSGLSPNTVYYARATAVSRTGQPSLTTVTGSTATLVSAPSGVAFTGVGTGGFSLSWGANGNPGGTVYYVRVSSDALYATFVASAATTGLSASFSGLMSNATYYSSVAGLNLFGTPSTFVGGSTSTLVAAPVFRPSPINARTASGIGFSWQRGTLSSSTIFTAQVSSDPGFGFLVTSSVTANTFVTFTTLQPNTTYYGRVNGMSLSSNASGPYLLAGTAATLPAPPGAAAAPFPMVGYTSMTVAWAPLNLSPPDVSSAAAEGYLVQLYTDAGFHAFAASTTALPGASSATLTGLALATTYYARVGSLSWEGLPSYSVVGSTYPPIPPLSSGTVSGAVILAVPPSSPEISSIVVEVPSDAFPKGTKITAVASVGVNTAGGRTTEASSIAPFGATQAFDLSAGGLQPLTPIRITITYDPAQVPAGQSEGKLHLWRWDPASDQWTLVPSQADSRNHQLVASVEHFSSFAPFFTTAGTDLGAIRVFPQPWETDAPSSQYFSNALTFSSLPASARVRLLTLTGELVFDGTSSGGGVLAWDGTTRFGRRAASGTYYAIIEANGQRLVRRVVIIR